MTTLGQSKRSLFTKKFIGTLFAVFALVVQPLAVLPLTAFAIAGTSYTQAPFTPGEVTNWSPDRTTPSGGYSSVSFGGRNKVLEMNIDNTLANTSSTFYQTEGLQRSIPASDTVKADLYLDSTWSSKQVRAGLWGVGEDAANTVSAYPIVEYNSAGWRIYNSMDGTWAAVAGASVAADSWHTLEVSLNKTQSTFGVFIDGAFVGTSPADTTTHLSNVILNSYNYATTNHSDDYSAHWSKFAYGTFPTAAPSTVYVDDSYTGPFDDGHIYGYNAFNTIEEGLDAVAANGTVHVYNGTYNNVNATDAYASNLTVQGHGTAIINGLDLTGAEFNGLTFDNFKFTGNSAGYGDFSFTIGDNGNYAGLTVSNSVFNGQNSAGRAAIFLNRGFDGFNLVGNNFKNYKNSASVYSLVFAEAQGAAMGDNFTASGNTLINANATNFLEAYRWKNTKFVGNNVNATSGRLLVWSDDSQALDTVELTSNVVNVTQGTGMGVFYAPSTTATVSGNTVSGAASCFKLDSVSDATITQNNFSNCSTVGLQVSQNGDTSVDDVLLVGNAFTGSAVDVRNTVPSFTLNASQNWWGVGTEANGPSASQYSGDVVVAPWCEQAACTSFMSRNQTAYFPLSGANEAVTSGPTTLVGSTPSGDATVTLQDGTTITASGGSWDGTLIAPVVTTTTIPATPGFDTTSGLVIKVGSDSLSFSVNPSARIVLPGQAGKHVGFKAPGGSFTEITNVCVADVQPAAPVNECKMDVGGDLVIWTNHFTTFATYTLTKTVTPLALVSLTQTKSSGSLFPSFFSVVPSTASTSSNQSQTGEVLGTATDTKTQAEDKDTAKDTTTKIFGLAWYWWVPILVILGGLTWFIVRRRSAE